MICSVWVARRIGARTKANKSLEIYFSCLLAVCVMQIFRQFPDKSLIPLWPISTNLIRPETKDSGNELALIRTISRLSPFRISSAPSRYLFNSSCILFSLLYMFSFYYAALRARHVEGKNQIFSYAFPTRLCLCIFNLDSPAGKKLKNNI